MTMEAEGSGRVITGRLCADRRRRRRTYTATPTSSPPPVHRPARVARVLALAHRLRDLLDTGQFETHTALARSLAIAVPRLTQLLQLTFLAPDIQEAVLDLEAVDGVEPLTERRLRGIVVDDWMAQRKAWRTLGLSGVATTKSEPS